MDYTLTFIANLVMTWATEHWWLAFWLAFWALWTAGWLTFFAVLSVGYAAACVIRLGNRVLRSINVLARGWPPAHLDADGDWKPEPKPPEPVLAASDKDTLEALYQSFRFAQLMLGIRGYESEARKVFDLTDAAMRRIKTAAKETT